MYIAASLQTSVLWTLLQSTDTAANWTKSWRYQHRLFSWLLCVDEVFKL